MKNFFFFLSVIISTTLHAQTIAPLWKNFTTASQLKHKAILPDFSYAGYHWSEKAIPSINAKKHYDVTAFGAIPNDNLFDDEAIQKTIHAAEANKDGGVVYFPPGKYLIAPDTLHTKHIRISKSNIVLKGSGSSAGGTEIHQANMRINGRQFMFMPQDKNLPKLATITNNEARGSFKVEVNNTFKLTVGQDVVIRHKSEAFTRFYFDTLALKPEWTRLYGDKGGMQVFEIHTIQKITGNTIWFKNPVQINIQMVKNASWEILQFKSIEECGIEDILFTSNWKNYPEAFLHHKNEIHDYAYEAIGMQFIKNSWIRNCVFSDWNEGIFIRSGYQLTIENIQFTGKKGHTSLHARTGYGVLVKNCRFNGAHHHGAGTGYSAVNTVFTQCSLGVDQNIDIHSGQPYATLFDNISGGIFQNLGGPVPGHPHHGKQLVLWNFNHASETDRHYNFWDMKRRRNFTIAHPIIAGFRSNKKVTFENEEINQLQGEAVLPSSLFDAQLKLRLTGKDVTKE